jgi:uncharacterized peroxidase-related enzyme
MPRLTAIELSKASGRAKELFVTVESAFGTVPNVAKLMANSPSVLESFLVFSAAMNGTKIGDKLLHQIKLATSEANTCDYCNSILTHLGKQRGILIEEMLEGRKAHSHDPKTDAALKFAKAVLETHGRIETEELQAVRKAGFDDTEIVEIVAGVVAACFTNFLNNVAETELDIPRAEPVRFA